MTKVLVLGATGFVGRHFSGIAESAGFEVVRGSGRSGDGDLVVDIRDISSVDNAVKAVEPDAVVNLAGFASVGASFDDPGATFAVNSLGVVNLLEAVTRRAADAHVLCVSSGEVYGAAGAVELPFTEDAPVRPESPYGVSKAAMELVCATYERTYGLRLAVMRPFNHTGPGQTDSFVASSVARQIAVAERDGSDEVAIRVGNLKPKRDFSDVRDIAQAYLLAIASEMSGTFNVCSGKPISIGDLVQTLADGSTVAVRTEVESQRMRPNEAPLAYGSAKRVELATGWRPEIPLSQTMADLLDWWRERIGK